MLAVPRQCSVVYCCAFPSRQSCQNNPKLWYQVRYCVLFVHYLGDHSAWTRMSTQIVHTQAELPEQVRQHWNRITRIQLSQNQGSHSFHGQRNEQQTALGQRAQGEKRCFAASLLLLVPEGKNCGSQMFLAICCLCFPEEMSTLCLWELFLLQCFLQL